MVRRQVTRKQHNSAMCLVCGLGNVSGLHCAFYELDSGEVVALYRPREEHQGYPGRLHGGIAAALLDETIGRAVNVGREGGLWGISLELTTRFRRPVPLDGEIRVVGRISRLGRRHFEGSGELLLPDGSVAVEGKGRYLKMPLEKIADPKLEESWKVTPLPGDPLEFEL